MRMRARTSPSKRLTLHCAVGSTLVSVHRKRTKGRLLKRAAMCSSVRPFCCHRRRSGPDEKASRRGGQTHPSHNRRRASSDAHALNADGGMRANANAAGNQANDTMSGILGSAPHFCTRYLPGKERERTRVHQTVRGLHGRKNGCKDEKRQISNALSVLDKLGAAGTGGAVNRQQAVLSREMACAEWRLSTCVQFACMDGVIATGTGRQAGQEQQGGGDGRTGTTQEHNQQRREHKAASRMTNTRASRMTNTRRSPGEECARLVRALRADTPSAQSGPFTHRAAASKLHESGVCFDCVGGQQDTKLRQRTEETRPVRSRGAPRSRHRSAMQNRVNQASPTLVENRVNQSIANRKQASERPRGQAPDSTQYESAAITLQVGETELTLMVLLTSAPHTSNRYLVAQRTAANLEPKRRVDAL